MASRADGYTGPSTGRETVASTHSHSKQPGKIHIFSNFPPSLLHSAFGSQYSIIKNSALRRFMGMAEPEPDRIARHTRHRNAGHSVFYAF